MSKNVQGYTIKKLQVKSILKKKISREKIEAKSSRKSYKISTEKWLESADRLIAGKADFIFNSDSYSKLSDFKTGNILDEGAIKKDFEDQLNLYAYLFKENFGKYPDALSLIDLQNNEHFIPISEEKCETLAQEAKSYLKWVNQCISDIRIDKIANPNEEICSSCLFRPACEFYWRKKNYNSELKFDDVKGLLVEVKKFKNGNINITINQNNQNILIYRIKDIFEEFLRDSLQKEIAIYNLKRVNNLTYQAIKTTKIYYAER